MLKDKIKGILTIIIILIISIAVIIATIYFGIISCPKQFENFISIVQSYLTCLAILIGGIWAISKFVIQRQNSLGLHIEPTLTTIHKSDNKYNWIILNVNLKNVGKRRIYLGKLNYACYEIREKKQELVFESNDNWLSLLSDENEPDLYIEPSEKLNRILYALVKKERNNLIFKIIFEDNPGKSPYKLSKSGEHFWGTYLYVRNVLPKSKE